MTPYKRGCAAIRCDVCGYVERLLHAEEDLRALVVVHLQHVHVRIRAVEPHLLPAEPRREKSDHFDGAISNIDGSLL